MASDAVIRDLVRQSVQGLEPEPTAVLADALLETDRPDLGEDLALILSNRMSFPLGKRGRPFIQRSERERALQVVFRRIHRRFAWSPYDREEQRRGLRELTMIATNWDGTTSRVQDEEVADAVVWLEEDTDDNSVLYERTTWLLDGTMGRGAQILGEEIVDSPPSRKNRMAQLFRLVLAFDDNLPPNAANRVWAQMSTRAKHQATKSIRRALVEHGGEVDAPLQRSRKR